MSEGFSVEGAASMEMRPFMSAAGKALFVSAGGTKQTQMRFAGERGGHAMRPVSCLSIGPLARFRGFPALLP